MKSMKKFVDNLQMSINEKDAEIIKLNMHLGDEKKKLKTLVKENSLGGNMSNSSLIRKSPESSHLIGKFNQ